MLTQQSVDRSGRIPNSAHSCLCSAIQYWNDGNPSTVEAAGRFTITQTFISSPLPHQKAHTVSFTFFHIVFVMLHCDRNKDSCLM